MRRLTIGWLSSALTKDQLSVGEQLHACFRAVAACAIACFVTVALLIVVALDGGSRVGVAVTGLLVVAALVALALFAMATFEVVRRGVATPLAELASVARRVGGGDLRAVDEPHGPIEFQQIGSALSVLANAVLAERNHRAADRRAGERETGTLRRVLKLTQEVSVSLNVNDVMKALASGSMSIGGFSEATIWFVDELDNRLTPAFRSRRPGEDSDSALEPQPLVGNPLARAISTSQTVRLRATDGTEDGLAVPVVLGVGLSVLGIVELRRPGDRPVSADAIDAIETLATHAAMAINASRLHHEVEQRSETDGLTKVYNRRKLEGDLKGEVIRSLRYGHPLALVMVDVDHFKTINDSFGHQQGDEVLKTVAQTIARYGRETDSVYRFGGEEFAVLLRETDAIGAQEVAERLRIRITEAIGTLGLPNPVTASLGVACIGGDVRGADKLVEAADAALYEAKSAGRNRVVVSAPVPNL